MLTRSKKQKGGQVQPFPLNYYNASFKSDIVDAGQDLLKTSNQVVRNFLPRFGIQGGTRRKLKKSYKSKKGGFLPSVMEPFSAATSKYIAPVALFAAYKFMTRKNKSKRLKTRRSH